MSRFMTSAALALLLGSATAHAAVFQVNGNFASYTTVLGAVDPYGLGLPETFTLLMNTNGASVVNGTLTFTGGSGKQLSVSGGTINLGATTDFVGISVANTGGAIGGTLNLSFATAIPNSTQAGLDTLIGIQGASSLFGFPFTNGAQGFYQGPVTAVAAPEPVTLGAIALALPLIRRQRR